MRRPTSSCAEAIVPYVPRVRVTSYTRKLVVSGLLLAMACVLGLVESALGSPVPGVRLGLANIAVVVALYVCGPAAALAVSVLRVVIVGLATGTFAGPVMVLALSGAVCAWAAMSAVRLCGDRFSIMGLSATGAVAHVIAQFVAAAFLTGSVGVLRLATPAALVSLSLGLATGFVARHLLSQLDDTRSIGR
ncbi:MAG: Gx transporter family protein [Coriobacteriales bacterium]|nr:Gx transporter family protein [Actinomycetes bacterium]